MSPRPSTNPRSSTIHRRLDPAAYPRARAPSFALKVTYTLDFTVPGGNVTAVVTEPPANSD
ncbi:MAG: hypothetical protein AB7P03_28400 [Kofleriaceae bacterium]